MPAVAAAPVGQRVYQRDREVIERRPEKSSLKWVVPALGIVALGALGYGLLKNRQHQREVGVVSPEVQAEQGYREPEYKGPTEEELGLEHPRDFTVAAQPVADLEYIAYSHRAGEDTAYRMQLFDVALTPAALARVDANPHNRWLSAAEVARQEAFDGRPVSVTLPMLLSRAGLLDGP